MVRKLAYLVTAASVVAFTVGLIAVLSGGTGILAALLIVGFVGFMVGVSRSSTPVRV